MAGASAERDHLGSTCLVGDRSGRRGRGRHESEWGIGHGKRVYLGVNRRQWRCLQIGFGADLVWDCSSVVYKGGWCGKYRDGKIEDLVILMCPE